MSIDIEDLEAAGYKFEFEYGEWDYSWNITNVFTKDGRVFELSDSGCSCYGWGDNFSNVQDAIGQMHEVTRVPSLEEATCRYVSHQSPSPEGVQAAFRTLGLH